MIDSIRWVCHWLRWRDKLPYEIRGNGVISVKTEDIFKNKKCLEQIRALRNVRLGEVSNDNPFNG